MPIVKDASCLGKVFIPPLPRYVFGACCSNPGHCTNITLENHTSTILSKAEHLRALLKSELGRHGVTKHWVLDGWRDLIGVKGQDRKESIHSLSQVTAADNVHFTKEGYENLAHAINSTIGEKEKITAGNVHAGTAGRRGSFSWRGYLSPLLRFLWAPRDMLVKASQLWPLSPPRREKLSYSLFTEVYMVLAESLGYSPPNLSLGSLSRSAAPVLNIYRTCPMPRTIPNPYFPAGTKW
jgi:hypothetical protein